MDSAVDHTINILKYKILNSSSCIKLPKELDHLKKGLINIQNIDDNECIKWCLVRYLHPSDHNSEIIKKVENDFIGELDFKELRFFVKTRSIHKLTKKLSVLVFLIMETRKNIKSIC